MALYSDILTQVANTIDALALSGNPTVRRRKRFIALENEGTQIIVSPTTETALADEEGFENVVTIRYPVLIGICITIGSEVLDSDAENLMYTYRQAIRRALYSPAAIAVAEPCTGVELETQPDFALGGIRDNQNVSSMMMIYDICEPRYEV